MYSNTSTIPIPVSHIFNSGPTGNAEVELPPTHILDRCRHQLESAFRMEGGCEVVLGAGESVLVPEGWWHSAEGLDGPGVGVGLDEQRKLGHENYSKPDQVSLAFTTRGSSDASIARTQTPLNRSRAVASAVIMPRCIETFACYIVSQQAETTNSQPE